MRVDAAQIQRALANVLENALRVSPSDEPVNVRLTATRQDVLMRVTDHGPGVPEDERSGSSSRSTGSPAVPTSPVPVSASPSREGSPKRTAVGCGSSPAKVKARRSSSPSRSSSCPPRACRRMTRILVVDDEPQFLRALQTNLRGAGYEVVTATTAEEALSSAGLHPPEAIILDLLLPDGRGTDVCRELRKWTDAPIILVSAVGDEDEKIAALDAGADDYVTKPFAIGELLARLRAALRRAGPPTEPTLDHRRARRRPREAVGDDRGRSVHLTPHEFELLRVLAQNEGKLLTHKTILREVWGPAYQLESSYLHVFVSQLRRKLEADPARPRYILTEPGAGYRLVNPSERS